MPPQLIDVSHTVIHGQVTYKGLPAPLICDYLSRADSRSHYAPGVEFQIGKIEMVANTGAYLDSPFHRFADGADLAGLPLTSLANLEAVVVRAAGGRPIDAGAFAGLALAGRAVLVHTGWSRHFGADQYFEGHPFLTAAAAQYLKEAGASICVCCSASAAVSRARSGASTTTSQAKFPSMGWPPSSAAITGWAVAGSAVTIRRRKACGKARIIHHALRPRASVHASIHFTAFPPASHSPAPLAAVSPAAPWPSLAAACQPVESRWGWPWAALAPRRAPPASG